MCIYILYTYTACVYVYTIAYHKAKKIVGINFVVSLKFHQFVTFVLINFVDLEHIALICKAHGKKFSCSSMKFTKIKICLLYGILFSTTYVPSLVMYTLHITNSS